MSSSGSWGYWARESSEFFDADRLQAPSLSGAISREALDEPSGNGARVVARIPDCQVSWDDGREHPGRPREVAGVAVGAAQQIVLVFGLSLPERPSWRDLGDDLARPQPAGVDIGDRVLGDPALFFVEVEDRRPVGRPPVIALPVRGAGSWIWKKNSNSSR